MPSRRDLIGAGVALAASPVFAQVEGTPVSPVADTPRLKIIGLEEHVTPPQFQAAWTRAGLPETPEVGFGDSPVAQRLRDAGDQRVADMDDQGVDMQVLSLATPGVQSLAMAQAVAVAREANDALAGIVRGRPDRFQAFAALPTPDPDAAAAELERAITELGLCGGMLYGRTGDLKPEAREFDALYDTAERLGVPLYFHPQRPVQGVLDAYYSGMNDALDGGLATAGLGWYYDLGVQVLRMVFMGVFDRHPDLQVVLGHWGEVVLFFLDHVGIMEGAAEMERPLMDYFRTNVWVTGSGTTSERYQRWTAEVVGVDRMLYATDYPYTFGTGYPYIETSGGVGRSFLADAPTFTAEEKAAIGSGNWKGLIAPVTDGFE